jgi:hypothetical protein
VLDSGFESKIEGLLSKITSPAITDAQRHVGEKAENDGNGIWSNDNDSRDISERKFGNYSQDFEDDFAFSY